MADVRQGWTDSEAFMGRDEIQLAVIIETCGFFMHLCVSQCMAGNQGPVWRLQNTSFLETAKQNIKTQQSCRSSVREGCTLFQQ